MSETLKIALTAVAGVGVFVLGQIIQRIFIESIQEQRRIVGRIAHAVTYYANMTYPIGIDPDQLASPALATDAMKVVRGLASDLRATLTTIPMYPLMRVLGLVWSRDNVVKASSELIGMSNSFTTYTPGTDRQTTVDNIVRLLRLKHR